MMDGPGVALLSHDDLAKLSVNKARGALTLPTPIHGDLFHYRAGLTCSFDRD